MLIVQTAADIGLEVMVTFMTVLRDFMAFKLAGICIGAIGAKILAEMI